MENFGWNEQKRTNSTTSVHQKVSGVQVSEGIICRSEFVMFVQGNIQGIVQS
jgi:hypothetical protein